MDRKTENLLYYINKTLFEDENPFEDDDEALEFANRMKQAGVQFKDAAQNYGSRVANTTKDLWNQASTSIGNKIDGAKEWWDIKNRDWADAANEQSMNAYNQRLKDQELADIRARDAADARNQDFSNWEKNRKAQELADIKAMDAANNENEKSLKQFHNKESMRQFLNDPKNIAKWNNDVKNADLPTGLGLTPPPGMKEVTASATDPAWYDKAWDWAKSNPQYSIPMAAGVPLALTGGYLAYRKLKNRKK